MADAVLLSFSYGAGVLSFFSPCAFPLLPAYVSAYLAKGTEEEGTALGRGLFLGGLALLGMTVVFTGLGAALGFVGARFIGSAVPLFGLGMGVLLAGLGAALLVTHRLSFAVPLRAPRLRGPGSFFLFGVAYALVSLGCTFPIFLVVVTGALLSQGFVSGVLVFLVYTLGLGTVLIFVTLAVATSREAVAGRLGAATRYVRLASALVLLVVGGYMVHFYAGLVTAGG